MGLIGFGNIAKKLAEKAKSLGLSLLTYDSYISNEIMKNYEYIKNVDFLELLEKSVFFFLSKEESQIELQTKAVEGVRDVLFGKRPKYLINKEIWNQNVEV